MIYIFDQTGQYGFAVDNPSDLAARILKSVCAETQKEFYLIELTKTTWTPDAPDGKQDLPNTTLKAGLYRLKDEAADELIRLNQLIKGKPDPSKIGFFQFKSTDITAIELTNLKHPFI